MSAASRRWLTVEVRPRVSGQITAVHFTDGAMVRQGQLLFTIDRRPFEASLAEAKAGLASARSEALLAQSDLTRAQKLGDDEAVSQSELDRLRARVQASQASVAGAQARVEARALELDPPGRARRSAAGSRTAGSMRATSSWPGRAAARRSPRSTRWIRST